MTRWIHPPEAERARRPDRDPDRFDLAAEAARYGLADELSRAVWERACAEATDDRGRRDGARARLRFHELAAKVAARGPGIGKQTRVGVELDGDPLSATRQSPVAIHRKADGAGGDASAPVVNEALQRRGRGEPLPYGLRKELETVFGVDLDRVRIHLDAVADAAARAVGATAFTVGEDLYFAAGAYAPDSATGKKLLVHELTHVVQAYQGRVPGATSARISDPSDPLEQEAEAVADRHELAPRAARRSPFEPPPRSSLVLRAPGPAKDPVEDVGAALRDNKIADSYPLMEKLTWDQARSVLVKFQADAVKAYNNNEMGKATEILVRRGGRLDLALDWMFDEGTSWKLLRATVAACSDDNWKKMVRVDRYRDLFVDEINNDQMAELVDLLGGDLVWKLGWMFAEGTDFKHVRAKIAAAKAADPNQMKTLQTQNWRDFFVKEYGNDEIADLAILIGGDIETNLTWMLDEGTDAKHIMAAIKDAKAHGQSLTRIQTTAWRDRFVKELGNREIYELVKVIGLSLENQINWMFEEGCDDAWVAERLSSAPEADRVHALVFAATQDSWTKLLKEQLWALVGANTKPLFGAAVDGFWKGFGDGSKFTAAQCYQFLFLLTGRSPHRAGVATAGSTKYKVVDADDETLRAFLGILKPGGTSGAGGIDRRELSLAELAFCSHQDTGGGAGWELLKTSYFDSPLIVIRVIGTHMDDNALANFGTTPSAVGTGLTFFQNHVRHEIGHAVGNQKIGTMAERGNDFSLGYAGWKSNGSSAKLLAAMWKGPAKPGATWPAISINGVTIHPTSDEVRDWCIGVLSNGKEPANSIGATAGDVTTKLAAISGSIWSAEKLVGYLKAIGASDPAKVPDSAYHFAGFTPTSPVQVYLTRWGGWVEYDKAAHDAFQNISWYALSSPNEMFAEMYTARYAQKTLPAAVNGKDPSAFFTELEKQRDPMFGK
jgi:hypothetical protein